MASVRDVENAIKQIVTATIYPNGASSPSVISPATVRIANGWPVSEVLDRDLLAGNAQITVFPVGMSDKNTTRFTQIWQESQRNSATLFASVSGNEIILTGTVTVPQAVLIVLDKQNYGHEVLPTDTLDSIAAALAAIMPSATAAGGVITVNGAFLSLAAHIVVTGKLAMEYKRQKKLFYVNVFAPNAAKREILGNAVEQALGQSIYLEFDDGTSAPIFYKGILEQDAFEKNKVYQRTLVWDIEYPSMVYREGTEIQSIYADIENIT